MLGHCHFFIFFDLEKTMKRFHVHLSVEDLNKSVGFYSTLFSAEPSVLHGDYAKWMLDEPAVNFAISTRGSAPGLDHLGFQVDSTEELRVLTTRLEAADVAVLDQGMANCCYAQSDKGWVHDPQGVAWETFHTVGAATTYGAQAAVQPATAKTSSACCGPSQVTPAPAASCCGPSSGAK
jgi:catechol 2,3-dioxygenase-like lactoylglutathione lyase family enzyme